MPYRKNKADYIVKPDKYKHKKPKSNNPWSRNYDDSVKGEDTSLSQPQDYSQGYQNPYVHTPDAPVFDRPSVQDNEANLRNFIADSSKPPHLQNRWKQQSSKPDFSQLSDREKCCCESKGEDNSDLENMGKVEYRYGKAYHEEKPIWNKAKQPWEKSAWEARKDGDRMMMGHRKSLRHLSIDEVLFQFDLSGSPDKKGGIILSYNYDFESKQGSIWYENKLYEETAENAETYKIAIDKFKIPIDNLLSKSELARKFYQDMLKKKKDTPIRVVIAEGTSSYYRELDVLKIGKQAAPIRLITGIDTQPDITNDVFHELSHAYMLYMGLIDDGDYEITINENNVIIVDTHYKLADCIGNKGVIQRFYNEEKAVHWENLYRVEQGLVLRLTYPYDFLRHTPFDIIPVEVILIRETMNHTHKRIFSYPQYDYGK